MHLWLTILCFIAGLPVRYVSVGWAQESTVATRPCTTRPSLQPETVAFNAPNYGDDDELVSQLAIDEQLIVNRTLSTKTSTSGGDIGFLPGLLATLQRRIKASVRSTGGSGGQQQLQQHSPGKERSLLPRLADVLARYGLRLPAGLLTSSVQPNDLCSRENADHIKQYCLGLNDANYYDPWNPWCGYVECQGNKSVRRTCPTGRWMGIPTSPDGTILTQVSMCRVPLPSSTSSVSSSPAGVCSETTMQDDMCRQAEAANSVTPYVDPAEDLQSSLSDLFLKKNEENIEQTPPVN